MGIMDQIDAEYEKKKKQQEADQKANPQTASQSIMAQIDAGTYKAATPPARPATPSQQATKANKGNPVTNFFGTVVKDVKNVANAVGGLFAQPDPNTAGDKLNSTLNTPSSQSKIDLTNNPYAPKVIAQIQPKNVIDSVHGATIGAAPPKTPLDKVGDFVNNILNFFTPPDAKTDPISQVARAQNAYAILKTHPDLKKTTSLTELAQPGGNPFQNSKMEEVTKQLGIRNDLSNADFTSLMFALSFPVTAAAEVSTIGAAGVAKQVLNLGKFVAVSTAFDVGFQKLTGKNSISALLPDNTPQLAKISVDALELIGKGFLTYGVNKYADNITDLLTKKIITDYKLPQNYLISAKDLRALDNPVTNQLLKDLNITGSDLTSLRKAAVNGSEVNVTVPATKIVSIVDRPYWAKVKSIFKVAPSEPQILPTDNAGVQTTPIAGQLPAPSTNDITMTPDQVREHINITDLKGTEIGNQLATLADSAEKDGKSLSITTSSNGVLAGTELKGTTPGGLKINVSLVDPVKLVAETQSQQPEVPTAKTDVPVSTETAINSPESKLPESASIPAPEIGKKLTPFDTPEVLKARADSAAAPITAQIDTPERQQLRKDAVNTLEKQGSFSGNDANGKPTFTGEVATNKRADIIIGAPGAGKSTQIANPLSQKVKARIVDSDNAKKLLPEFKANSNLANAVHEESDLINNELISRSVVKGENIIVPITGKNADRVRAYRDKLIRDGYEVHLHLNDLEPVKAARRVISRYQENGQGFVDPNYVLNDVGLNPAKNYDILKTENGFTSYAKYSNDVPKGTPAKLIENSPTATIVGEDRRLQGSRNSGSTGRSPQKTPSPQEQELAQIIKEPITVTSPIEGLKPGQFTVPKLPQVQEQPGNSSSTFKAEIIPGLEPFIKEDIVPKTKSLLSGVSNVYKEITATFNPVSKADPKAVDVLMRNKGVMERDVFRMEQATKNIFKMWDRQPLEARFEFMNRVETGQAVPAGFEELAQMYRERLDNAHTAISQFKEINFLDNFFPHFWKNPEAIEKNFVPGINGRRPFQGTKSFLKQRVFATIQEGQKAGYQLITDNPEELMQIYEQNVRKFVMAQTIKKEFTQLGEFKFFKKVDKLPEGWSEINDSIAKIYFPQEIIVKDTGVEKTQLVEAGRFAAPEATARLVNNMLSRDFIYDSALGKGLMNVKNTMNFFELGISGFHALFETVDAMTSRNALAFGKLARRDVLGAAKDLVTAPIAPFLYFNDGRKFYNGDKELMQIENDLFTGGARLRKNEYYKNTVFDTMLQNIRQGNVIGAALRAPMGIIEGSMRPLLNYYVPRLKVGAFRDLFANELERNAPKLERGEISRETIARNTWQNIEDRLGELNYDNLFWNRTVKTSAMLGVRSVGWNLGSIRSLGGATFQDIPKFVFRTARFKFTGKDSVEFTPKMQYLMGLIFTAAAIGGIYHYLHTGEAPKSITDYFYPKNGQKDRNGNDIRVQLPTYLKDIYGFATKPLQTIANKTSPELSTIIALLQNKDYFGDFIRNTNDNVPTQTKQVAAYIISAFEPFSFQQIGQIGKNPLTGIEAFFGLTKAPAEIIQGPREAAIYKALDEQGGGQGPRTPEQVAIAALKTQARDELITGDTTTLNKLIDLGVLKKGRSVQDFIRLAKLTPSDRAYQGLSKETKKKIDALYGKP